VPRLIVVDNPKDWPLDVPGVELVAGRAYLADPRYSGLRNAKVYNLCRSYRYQTIGYYVSLLAAARGHRPLPSISTIQDMKSQTILRFVSEDLDELIQHSLAAIVSGSFTLSVYFGRNPARRYDRLSLHLFNLFQAPLLRAQFAHGAKWELQSLRPIDAGEIPEDHQPFVVETATEYFAGHLPSVPKRTACLYDLAILFNPHEKEPASDEKAIQRFIKAAGSLRLNTELVDRDDYASIGQFDALFIRETTNVNHHTFRFAQRAVAEGLVVMDDPDSILKCTNKVYLAELLGHHRVPTPKTLIVHRDNVDAIVAELGLPCVLKQPDSSFSQGVVKVDDEASLEDAVERLLEKSDLIIAQEFLPTTFDWRVGIIDREPLYVCRYHMAHKHWQIVKRDGRDRGRYGKVDTVPVELAPKHVVQTALRAANLIGDSLYGVDIKQVERKCYVIEINDNPTIEAGVEDAVLKDELYWRIMRVFLKRIRRRKEGG
jgi:glutathione synthase/RimK-type ligase-like ATP-grasp enzyme